MLNSEFISLSLFKRTLKILLNTVISAKNVFCAVKRSCRRHHCWRNCDLNRMLENDFGNLIWTLYRTAVGK